MKISEAFKKGNNDLRVTNGDKWLYYDHENKEWVVRTQPYRAKKSITLYNGESEELAVAILVD